MLDKNKIREITVQKLNVLITEKQPFAILDVRELDEYRAANLGGQFIPVAEILHRYKEIDANIFTAVLCRSGKRSAAAILQLQQLGYENLHNVKGGILAFAAEIDKNLKPI